MASNKPRLTVIRSPTAIDELQEIWLWNAQHYGVTHADTYLHFLTDTIDSLSSAYAKGKTVVTRSDLRHIIVRRRAKGHGYVVVYNFNDSEVHILHVFHTARNWETQLAEE